jgi:hypothetical protein
VFLTNGALSGATTQGFATNATAQLNSLRGIAGQPPRLAPFWRDLELTQANDAGVFINNTLPGKFVVTWQNAVQFNTAGPLFTIQLQLHASGQVTFHYGATTVSVAPVILGVSAGDGIAAVPQVDFSSGSTTSTTLLHFERFASNAFDLAGRCIQFTPGGGGFSAITAQPASHTGYGAGCYEIATESFYQGFANAVVASAALAGQSLVFTPAAAGYTATFGGGSYLAPSGAAVPLALGDDTELPVTPSLPLPTPFGPVSELRVHANAVVTLGNQPQTFPGTNPYTPTPAALLAASRTAFWAWHDYNPAEAGSGPVSYEERVIGSDTVALLTWDGVENYSLPNPLPNPSTLQFQLNLTTGVVTLVWVAVDNNATSQFGSGHLIGFSPGGASQDPGSINLATALPRTTSPDREALRLSASPEPRSTATTGTTVTYTTENVPEAAPGTGVYVGALILSPAGVPLPGVELGFLGAPGCRAHVLTLASTQALVGGTPTLTTTFVVPAGIAEGFELFAQSCGLVVPFSLPNGQNSFGLVTSNGVRSYISPL